MNWKICSGVGKKRKRRKMVLSYSSHSRLAQLWRVNKYIYEKSTVAFSEVLKATQERGFLHSKTSEHYASP
jgi:hypothetical protein